MLSFLLLGCGKSTAPGFGSGGTWVPPGSNDATGGGGSSSGGDTDGGSTPDTDTGDGGTGTEDTGDDVVERDLDGGPADGDVEDTGFTIEGTGYDDGDIAYNLSGTDQSSMPFELHSLYGQKIVLVVGNMDVEATRDTLSGIQEIMGDHSGVRFVAYIGNDVYGIPCTQSCAAEIASTYGFSTVMFGSASAASTLSAWLGPSNTHTYLIHSTMEIYWERTGSSNATVVSGRIDSLE